MLLGTLVTKGIEQDTIHEIQGELKSEALMFRAIVAQWKKSGDGDLQDWIMQIGSEVNTRLTLIDKSGRVLADSHENPSVMDNHMDRLEIATAKDRGEGTSSRYSQTIGRQMIYYAIPIVDKGKISGYARTSTSLENLDNELSRLRRSVFWGSIITVFVAMMLGYYLARNFSNPLESMTRVAESMSEGNYDERLAENRNDEIGRLAKALNRMSKNLKMRIEALSSEKNRLKAILAGMVEGVIAVDKNERIVLINNAACTITENYREESRGLPLWEVCRIEGLNKMLSVSLSEKREIKQKIRVVGADRDRHIEVVSSPMFIAGGELAGAVIVLHDITELHTLERVRRDFVANVSHELKTPIAAIMAMVETIIEDKEMTRVNEERFLKKISEQSVRLSTLVNDVLSIASIESEKRPSDARNIDIASIIDNVVALLMSKSEAGGIAMETELPDKKAYVKGDKEAMTQAISNLADNALTYTPKGGAVCIRLKVDDKTVIIEVEDTGIGIEPHHQQRIFERFYRVDTARSRELGGTGLGLSIVKHVALSHGGNVEVISRPGEGSVFRIKLPLVTDA